MMIMIVVIMLIEECVQVCVTKLVVPQIALYLVGHVHTFSIVWEHSPLLVQAAVTAVPSIVPGESFSNLISAVQEDLLTAVLLA